MYESRENQMVVTTAKYKGYIANHIPNNESVIMVNKETKKIKALMLKRFVSNPFKKEDPSYSFISILAFLEGTKELNPIYIRYEAPMKLIANFKFVSDRTKIEIPEDARTECIKTPVPIPAAAK